jgi:glycosyltransferase involved in cell wall biosynthesis
VLFFGTYDEKSHPRVRVLREGLEQVGFEVEVLNEPLPFSTADRVALARQPWRAPVLVGRIATAWSRLWRAGTRFGAPEVVVVGYLGHADIHLARRRFPRATLVLDYLVSLEDTVRDRQVGGKAVRAILRAADIRALRAAEVVVVDTLEQHAALPSSAQPRSVVIPVGADSDWIAAGATARSDSHSAAPLRVVFFGLYTPLHGTKVIAQAMVGLRGEPVEFTMVGTGQDRAATQCLASGPPVRWVDWVDSASLPRVVAEHDVCLGIFGTTPKARRVVPTKLYQGAAAGCVLVTSDTPPQRQALGELARYVPPGDGASLAAELRKLAKIRTSVRADAGARAERARARVAPQVVVLPLAAELARRVTPPSS